MENASKALIMAGSILIALLTIGALMFMFDNISGVEKQKNQNAEIEATLEFNRQFEAFDMAGLRGTDILTVMNKMVNYNAGNDVKVEKYPEMSMNLVFTVNTTGNLTGNNNDLAKVSTWFDNDLKGSNKMTLKNLSQEEQTEFKRKYFRCTNVEYDNNTGRVIRMEFEEIDVK